MSPAERYTMADRVVAIAIKEVGVAEDPLGSNTGQRVMEYQATCAYSKTQRTGWPWCGAFWTWVQLHAGLVPNNGSASTAETYRLAKARGEISSTPAIGGAILWPGTHIGLIVGMNIDLGVVYTVEGNSGDKVSARTRAIRGTGAVFVVPKMLGQILAPPRLYWIDDDSADYYVKGPWRTEAYANNAKKKLSPAVQRRAEVQHTGDGKWVLRIGEDPRRGPFLDKAQRDDRLAKLEKTLGRKLIPRSTASKISPLAPVTGGPAEGLGKTD